MIVIGIPLRGGVEVESKKESYHLLWERKRELRKRLPHTKGEENSIGGNGEFLT